MRQHIMRVKSAKLTKAVRCKKSDKTNVSDQMFVFVRSHGQWIVGDFIGDRSPCRHFEHVWTTEVRTFNDWLEIPVHCGLISDREVLGLLGAHGCYNVVDVLGWRHCSARASDSQQQWTAAIHLACQVLQHHVLQRHILYKTATSTLFWVLIHAIACAPSRNKV